MGISKQQLEPQKTNYTESSRSKNFYTNTDNMTLPPLKYGWQTTPKRILVCHVKPSTIEESAARPINRNS
uniref:Uncharacterized protein n=1 Tax=Romanomermis culicivorax TaxID=13658 RepID=A0A915ITY1_ROMCU